MACVLCSLVTRLPDARCARPPRRSPSLCVRPPRPAQGPLDKVYRAALALGTANQLTNILRDVGEDAGQRNRIYVPLDELAAFKIREEEVRRPPCVGCPGFALLAFAARELSGWRAASCPWRVRPQHLTHLRLACTPSPALHSTLAGAQRHAVCGQHRAHR